MVYLVVSGVVHYDMKMGLRPTYSISYAYGPVCSKTQAALLPWRNGIR